ncbi:MAG: FAD binding domain-containing protein, partial [Myxococcales bacterium]|nr:FAD binding domain-containing protein [Myxococcales bacterium]
PNDRFRAAMNQYQARDAALELRAVDGLDGDQLYVQPPNLEAFFEARARHPEAVLLAGGTDLGLAVTKHHRHFPVVIGLEALPELETLVRTEAGWRIGARVSLTRIMETAGADFPALHKMLRWFGSRQIRSRATLGGNLGTASPIGDMAPVLAALGAQIVLAGSGGERQLPLADFFTGYRSTALSGDELILAVEIPFTPDAAYCSSFKVSKRREMDISSVSAGMYVELVDGRVHDVRLHYGGVAAKAAARATHAEDALRGKVWDETAVEAAMVALDHDFSPLSDQRGSAHYRTLVARNLLLGFYEESRSPDRGRLEPRPVGTAYVGGQA